MKIYFLIATFLLTGCTLFQKPQPPKVTLKEVRIENVHLQGARLIFELDAFNPNASVLAVDNVKYNLELNSKPVTEGALRDRIELKAKETTKLTIPIEIEFSKVFTSLLSALKKPQADYKIFGSAQVSGFTVPFEEKGTIDWQQKQD